MQFSDIQAQVNRRQSALSGKRAACCGDEYRYWSVGPVHNVGSVTTEAPCMDAPIWNRHLHEMASVPFTIGSISRWTESVM
jgi:hypothetical protein